jgi:NAD(P)-dependent dehydrogenase (short-subunit alcohol dehydrogenase family)
MTPTAARSPKESSSGAPRRAAIVTGGGSGLGRAIALVLAHAGVDCLIAGRRIEPLEETARRAGEGDAAIEPVVADVCRTEDRERLVRAGVDRFGRLDILVNNAGGGSAHPLSEFPAEAWRDDLAINLDAPFFLSQLAIPEMRRAGFGRIVNIASILGILANHAIVLAAGGVPTDARGVGYAAAKGGLISLTREMAAGVARDGITINAITPGYIERAERPRPESMVAAIEEMTPVGRAGEPADVAHAVRYLCSDEAGFVTGINLVVDGGWSIV